VFAKPLELMPITVLELGKGDCITMPELGKGDGIIVPELGMGDGIAVPMPCIVPPYIPPKYCGIVVCVIPSGAVGPGSMHGDTED
jgi:hypothetical protein